MDYLPILAYGGLAALVTGYVIAHNWKKIVERLRGKKVAVLGARGVGKTHLITFLSTGSIPQEYFQTLAPKRMSGRKFDLGELKLKFRETVDVPGDQAAYGIWESLFKDSDLVFYMFRVDRIKSGDTDAISRMRKDAEQIKQWTREMEEKKIAPPLLLMIGTFCDKDPDYISRTPSNMGDYQDSFIRLGDVKQVVQYINASWWVLSSMENLENTEKTTVRIFNAIRALK